MRANTRPSTSGTRGALGRLTLGALALAALSSGASCRNRTSVVVPNRVLDRPLDAVLACVKLEDGVYLPQSLEQCSDAEAEAVCGDLRLIGFVANSERNDVAMFSRCAGAVIDMDVGAPGPQLINAGSVPSSMTITTGPQTGCFAVSANLGSCDLSVLNVTGLSAYAFDEPPEDEPAQYVANVVPRRADGTPLGARPGQVVAVPPDLSNALRGPGGDAVCDPGYPGSVYVTFPSCQLVAEVDLRTQRVLQSRQFVRDDAGNVTVVDAGADPVCPVDCPEQFTEHEDALKTAPPGDPDGMYPLAMALVTPRPEADAEETGATCVDEADRQIEDSSLYVGGLGSDTLYELRFDGSLWSDDALELELTDAQGISAIRPTPPMEIQSQGGGGSGDGGYFQYLYMLAGDGSTRVVSRDFNVGRDELGIECDTQVDPTAVTNTACHPAEFPGEEPPDRRPFARGPGIRTPTGAIITDWTFQKQYPASCAGDPDIDPDASISSPFTGPGVVGVGSTSSGKLVFVTFDQFARYAGVDENVDFIGILDARVPPHTLWPRTDPFVADPAEEGLPRMADAAVQRLVAGGAEGSTLTRLLAPSLRLIDRAYAELANPPAPCTEDADCSGGTCDAAQGYCESEGVPRLQPRIDSVYNDLLGRDADEDATAADGLYEKNPPRAVVRDYRAWISGEWTLRWEDVIPATEGGRNGQLACDQPGWQEGTCLSTEAGDTRLIDQTAQFCDAGVLPGDKLLLLGCAQHSDCGAGQSCLLDADAPSGSTGLCVSQSVYEERSDELLTICRPFLRDPCGPAQREFLITRAFQQELWLQILDRPDQAYLMLGTGDPEVDADRDAICRGDRLEGLATEGPTAPTTYDVLSPGVPLVECEAKLSCSERQPADGCVSHDDCIVAGFEPLDEEGSDPITDPANRLNYPICVDGVCRRVCEPGAPDPRDPDKPQDCALRPLPGPACYRELLRYEVRARNSFVVRGPQQYDFLAQRVKADPETGECYEDPTVSNLLTSRIRLGRDESDTRNHALWPIPSCPANAPRPDAAAPNPCFIDTPREPQLDRDAVASLYHTFQFGSAVDPPAVPAIRYSNPMMSLVLDLTSLKDLAAPIPDQVTGWPDSFREFRRARIPGAYRETFSTSAGYAAYDLTVTTSNVALVGPTRIINAPELGTVYVVDSSGGGGTNGTRGQVVRVGVEGGQTNPDVRFLVR